MNNLRQTIFAALIVLLSAGCASSARMPMNDISMPPLNTPAEASLGERLLMQGRGFTGEVIDVYSLRGNFVSVEDQRFCRHNPAKNNFTSFDSRAVTYYNFVGGVRGRSNKLSYKKGKVCFSDMWSGCFDNSEANFRYQNNAVCSSPNALQRIIEYNGKSGNTLNFTYREVYGRRVASPITQNFTMDLNDGNEINYKGARLRVDQATNQRISYSVLRNFGSL